MKYLLQIIDFSKVFSSFDSNSIPVCPTKSTLVFVAKTLHLHIYKQHSQASFEFEELL